MKILLVEDDALLAWTLAELLSENGHTVLGPVDTIKSALLQAATRAPQLALVNIKLHGVDDGLTIVRQLNEQYHVPSVVVSGQADEARQLEAVALGFVSKPYSKETVLGAIEIARLIHDGHDPGLLPPGFELFRHHRSVPAPI